MKKVVRNVWIGTLSGLAFLAACCSTNGLSRKERKQLVKERDSIQKILEQREMAAVYGSPEIIANYGAENARLRYQVDSINNLLGKEVDMEKSKRRYELQRNLSQVMQELQFREGACVYGSPEAINRYAAETDRLRNQANELREQIKQLDE